MERVVTRAASKRLHRNSGFAWSESDVTGVEYYIVLEIDRAFEDYRRYSQFAGISAFKLIEAYLTGGK